MIVIEIAIAGGGGGGCGEKKGHRTVHFRKMIFSCKKHCAEREGECGEGNAAAVERESNRDVLAWRTDSNELGDVACGACEGLGRRRWWWSRCPKRRKNEHQNKIKLGDKDERLILYEYIYIYIILKRTTTTKIACCCHCSKASNLAAPHDKEEMRKLLQGFVDYLLLELSYFHSVFLSAVVACSLCLPMKDLYM